MQLTDFYYDLPSERIAQTPVDPRDHSRIMQINRNSKKITHHHFYDLPNLLQPGDLLVVNNTRVLPVRLLGKKTTGGAIEILLTKRYVINKETEKWQALTRPGLKPGQKAVFIDAEKNVFLEIECLENEGYTRKVSTSLSGEKLLAALNILGEIPTPPYIESFIGNAERYQTIFAKHAGSAAAPTAGLHFTPEVFSALAEKNIDWTEVTLHVGLGTFLPVKVNDIANHHMHSEWYEVSPHAAEKINSVKKSGGRIIAVGTTSLRTLESVANENNTVRSESGDTQLFVYPPYKFNLVDGIITNFHLPESTLLMLISAFCCAPQSDQEFKTFSTSLLGRAYTTAIEQEYRFFSFGDAMLIL